MPVARGGAKKYPGFASNREKSRWIGSRGVSAKWFQNKRTPNANRNPLIVTVGVVTYKLGVVAHAT